MPSFDLAPAVRRFVLFAPDGLVLPAGAFHLWIDLAARGFRLTAEAGALVVEPADRLSPGDCHALRRWRWHVLMLLDHPAARPAGLAPRLPAPVPTAPRCAHCDSDTTEPIGPAWWWCPCCARAFASAEATS